MVHCHQHLTAYFDTSCPGIYPSSLLVIDTYQHQETKTAKAIL